MASSPFSDYAGLDSGAAYVYELGLTGTYTDRGFGLAGTGGLMPVLTGQGPLCGNATFTLTLTSAVDMAYAYLVVSTTALNAPFKGGTLVPFPDLIVGPFLTYFPGGEMTVPAFWPPGLPAFELLAQWWIIDLGGPAGFSASNGLSLLSFGG